jgi:hypothetical protein
MEQNLDQLVRKKSLEKGLVLGVILLVTGIFTFYFITGMTDNMWLIIFAPLLFSVILPLVIAVFFTIGLRKEIGGFWTFRQAVTGVFIMFFTAFILSFVGRDLLFAKLIEPDMVEKMQTSMVNSTTAMMEKTGAEQEAIDKQTASIEKQFESQRDASIGAMVKNIAIGILFIFVVALIFGAIFKKQPLRNGLEDAIDPAEEQV